MRLGMPLQARLLEPLHGVDQPAAVAIAFVLDPGDRRTEGCQATACLPEMEKVALQQLPGLREVALRRRVGSRRHTGHPTTKLIRIDCGAKIAHHDAALAPLQPQVVEVLRQHLRLPVRLGDRRAEEVRNQAAVLGHGRGSEESEAGAMTSEQILADMGKYNEELARAGVMLAGDGLHPSSKGKRVRFSADQKTVIDGPFAETKELIAGYWIWQVRSMEEAV